MEWSRDMDEIDKDGGGGYGKDKDGRSGGKGARVGR